MLLPALVVLEGLFLDRLFDKGAGDPTAALPCLVRKRDRRFKAVQGGAGVPIRRPDDVGQRLRLDIEAEGAEPPFTVRQRVPDDPGKILLGEPSEAVATLSDPSPVRLAPMVMLSATIMVVGLMPAWMYETIRSATGPLLSRLIGG